MPEIKGREDLVRHRYLLDRVLRERDADGVLYAVRQKLSERGCALYGAGQLGSGLGDAEWSGASECLRNSLLASTISGTWLP